MRLCGLTRFVVKRFGSSNWRFSGGREVTWNDGEGWAGQQDLFFERSGGEGLVT